MNGQEPEGRTRSKRNRKKPQRIALNGALNIMRNFLDSIFDGVSALLQEPFRLELTILQLRGNGILHVFHDFIHGSLNLLAKPLGGLAAESRSSLACGIGLSVYRNVSHIGIPHGFR